MLFNSFIFIPFVLCVFVMALVAGQRVRVLALIAFSYVFYSVPYPPWIVLLLLCTVGDFYLSRWIDRSQAPTSRRLAVVVSCALNLGLLAAYKYAAFLALSINDIAQALGGSPMLPVYQPDLPLGISFFVFESLSYTIDVYRRRLKPAQSLADYALFICFFPHLIAGPIVRGRDFLPQIARHLPFQRANTIAGAELVAFGILKKSVIADNLAPHVDLAFADPGSLSGVGAWIAVIFFAIQIYCDFSGYTDIARGLARILGFELGRNFNWPYLSQSISDFWRRWHISLSTWLRDYLYIPLGGNRHGVPRMLWALLITWFLGGLWHGAAWHFALWGLYHGLIVGLGGLLYARFGSRLWDPLAPTGRVAITFLLVVVGWVLFRANSVPAAWTFFDLMFQPWSTRFLPKTLADLAVPVGVIAALATAHYFSWRAYRGDEDGSMLLELPYVARAATLALALLAVILFAGKSQTFIYFQF
jgi:alginate O-acetyltransferase complex protein AlgI